jgi:hypothetical protein
LVKVQRRKFKHACLKRCKHSLKTDSINLTTRCFADDPEEHIRLYTWWNQRPRGYALNEDYPHVQTFVKHYKHNSECTLFVEQKTPTIRPQFIHITHVNYVHYLGAQIQIEMTHEILKRSQLIQKRHMTLSLLRLQIQFNCIKHVSHLKYFF